LTDEFTRRKWIKSSIFRGMIQRIFLTFSMSFGFGKKDTSIHLSYNFNIF
jgi:hypothetical protein